MNTDNKGSRGEMRICRLFSASEIGVSVPEPHVDRAIRIFVDVGSDEGYQAITPRLCQMTNGVLLLLSIDGKPDSGAIYIYDRESGDFFAVTFEGAEDNLTVAEYDAVVAEYKLLEFAARPKLLTVPVLTRATA